MNQISADKFAAFNAGMLLVFCAAGVVAMVAFLF